MARTVNEQEYARKRDEILDAAMGIIFSKGYERMTIKDIIAALRISSGAFYHYFDSKPALVEAFIERIGRVSEQPLLPIISDPHLSAPEKLRGYFATFDQLRRVNMADVVEMSRFWYADANALVRQKVEEAVVEQRAPLLARIVRQGVEEGVWASAHPDQAGEVLMSLVKGMEDTFVRLLRSARKGDDGTECVEAILATHVAYMDAIERYLGAPSGSLQRADVESVRAWVNAMTEEEGE